MPPPEGSTSSECSPHRPSTAWRVGPVFAILLASAHALHSGWGRWGSLYLDTGRELEWPRRILEGEKLYSELRYFYGPLAPYLNAFLYRLFGVHVDVLAAAGAVSGVVVALTVYAIAKRFVGRFAATLSAVTFVYVLGFAHLLPVGTFNFVLPYSFSATYGMLGALLSLAFLLAHVDSSRRARFFVSLLFLFLAALSKLEPLVPALAAHLVFATAAIASKRFDRTHALGYASVAIASGAAYGFFYLRTGPALFSDNLGGVVNRGSDYFIRTSMGLTDLGGNLRAAAVSAALIGATAAAALGTAALARRAQTGKATKIAALAAAGGVVLVLALRAEPEAPFRALPFFSVLALAVSAFRWWVARTVPDLRARVLPHVLLAAFTAAASLRIFFAATPEHYGFYLLAPAGVSLAVLLFDYVPRLAPASAWSRYAMGACGAALLLGNSAVAFRASRASAAENTLAFRSPRGTLRAPAEAGEVMPMLAMIARSPTDARLVVVPHGTAFNFLMARRGPADGMSEYLPMVFYGGYDDDAVVARWERDPPDLVLWHDWTLSDMGNERFGVTYAVEAGRWLLTHYEAVTDPGAPIVLLKRRTSGSNSTSQRPEGRQGWTPSASRPSSASAP